MRFRWTFALILLTLSLPISCSDDDDDAANDDDLVDDDDLSDDDDDDIANDDDDIDPGDDDDDTVDDDDLGDDDDSDPTYSFDDVPIDPQPAPSLARPNARTEILFDLSGVPHIYGQSVSDAIFGLGFVHARDRAYQMDWLRRTVTGRLAELVGPNALASDTQFRALDLRRVIQRRLETLSTQRLELLQAYADGVNAARTLLAEDAVQAEALGLRLDPMYAELDQWEAWEPSDSIAVMTLYLFSLSFNLDDLDRGLALDAAQAAFAGTSREGLERDLFRLAPNGRVSIDDVGAADAPPPAPKLRTAPNPSPPAPRFSPLEIEETLRNLFGDPIRGTNAWAIEGRHTANGLPLLAFDPHLALDNPASLYEAQIDVGILGDSEPWSLSGFGLPGMPLFIGGFNDQKAFALVAALADVTDVWNEPLIVLDPPTVDHPDGAQELESFDETIELADGSTQQMTFHRHPLRGPVIAVDEVGGTALTLSWNGYRIEADEFGAWWDLQTATDVEAFQHSIGRFGAGSMHALGAFASGEIVAGLGGAIPVRADSQPGTANPPWRMYEDSHSGTWTGWLAPEEKPSSVHPPNGWIVLANQDPTGATWDGDPLNDGLYLGTVFDNGLRAARIVEKLAAGVAHDVSYAMEIQTDVLDPLAQVLIPHALAAIDANPNGLADTDARIAIARDLWSRWDHRAESGFRFDPSVGEFVMEGVGDAQRDASVSTTLFAAFTQALYEATMGDEEDASGAAFGSTFQRRFLYALFVRPYELEVAPAIYFDDLNTPNAETSEEIIVTALLRALGALSNEPLEDGTTSSDPTDWRWGRFHRVTLDSQDPNRTLPEDGSGYPYPGVSQSVSPAGFTNRCCGRFQFGSGAAARLIVQLEPEGEHRAFSILAGGESAHADDSHYADQLYLWLDGQYLENPHRFPKVAEEAQRWISIRSEP